MLEIIFFLTFPTYEKLWISNLKCAKGHMIIKTTFVGGFPGDSVAKALHFQCRGPGLDPWSGEQIPHATTVHMLPLKKKKKKKILHAAMKMEDPKCHN